MSLGVTTVDGEQEAITELLAGFVYATQNDAAFCHASKIQVDIDSPDLDLTFDWRAVPGSHWNIQFDWASDIPIRERRITVRLLGYDRGAEVLGLNRFATVYTDDPTRQTYPSWDEEVTRRPTVLLP